MHSLKAGLKQIMNDAGPSSTKKSFVIAAKLACSAFLVAATLGLTGHQTGAPDLWPTQAPSSATLPDWVVHLAGGWYGAVVEQAAGFAAHSTLHLVIYVSTQVALIAAVFAVPFLTLGIARYLLSAILLGGTAYD